VGIFIFSIPQKYFSKSLNNRTLTFKNLNHLIIAMKTMLPIVLLGFFAFLISSCTTPEKSAGGDEKKIDSLLSVLTLEEKVTLIHGESSFTAGGVPRLGIPHWVMSDGPHGVRKEQGTDYVADDDGKDSATYLPVGITLASTWNPELGYAYGTVLGQEAKFRGKDVILGPGINIMRTPVNGRNFEYLSEDPYLVSRMVVGYIKGVQDQEISACVKHYAANNQEVDRNSVNVEMSERALREIYLPGFKAAVQEGGVNTLMGAYNKFRGQFATHNDYLMNKILKGEWAFQGAVISDWNAARNTMEAINNGLDCEMGTDLSLGPNPNYGKYFLGDTVIALVKAGTVDVKLIDEKVRRILRTMNKTKMLGGTRSPGSFNTPEHQATALKVAEEGIVLLKNDKILPLQKDKVKTIAVIGANAARKHAGSGGSSQVNAKYEVTALAGLQKIAGATIKIEYAPGYEITREGKSNAKLIQDAVRIASKADVVIYVGGWIHGYSDAWNDNAFDSESVDKPNINLPFGQEELVAAVQKANPNNIVVIYSGSGTDMTTWGDQAKGIIQAWYPGMEGGTALAKIIFGQTNPSGKLPVTFAKKLMDVPAHSLGEYPGKDGVVHYNEGIMVGYRYHDTRKVAPRFAFGHGLSYTTFAFENLTVQKGENEATVKLTVKNTGSVAGAEVVQIYVKDDASSVERPDKELKAFSKVFLQPGESKEVTLTLKKDAFQYYDEGKKDWTLEAGKFTILAGNAADDIKLTGEVSF
jgi:beta-glucosidase